MTKALAPGLLRAIICESLRFAHDELARWPEWQRLNKDRYERHGELWQVITDSEKLRGRWIVDIHYIGEQRSAHMAEMIRARTWRGES